MAKSSLWIAVLIVLLVGVGGYFVFSRQPERTMESKTESVTQETENTEDGAMVENKTVEVIYNGTVFTPQSVTVKKGTTVKFTNQSETKMWVASSPHPQHTDLPGFDQLQGSDNGSSYEYTFEKSGSWKFHNHLNPKAFGTVVVEQ